MNYQVKNNFIPDGRAIFLQWEGPFDPDRLNWLIDSKFNFIKEVYRGQNNVFTEDWAIWEHETRVV